VSSSELDQAQEGGERRGRDDSASDGPDAADLDQQSAAKQPRTRVPAHEKVAGMASFKAGCSFLNQKVPGFLEALFDSAADGTLDYNGYVPAGHGPVAQLFRTLLGV
jgi:hypothetical protein